MPDLTEQVRWVDQQGNQVGPEPLETVVQRANAGQIPATTVIWWEGASGWTPLSSVAQLTSTASASAAVAPTAASAALMSGLTDQELDDQFIDLIDRSWVMYKETEFATSIDEVMLGGVVTALVDCGFALIDLGTAGTPAATTTTTTGAGAAPVIPNCHELRFEEPQTHSRVTLTLKHLTPDPAVAKMIGHRAEVVIGYGQRVPNFTRVGQALRQEVQSSFIVSPEPGTVTFDADLSSGYVYAQVDLLLDLGRYVDEHFAVDNDLLRRHLASVVYTMQTFVQSRFGS
ncbi:MAG: DUF4339 domain-containing protein [Candidatus Nanopelagicales bacterium]|nr:DUF4339 domain-containing protein [Candidatus Nanopelagicales bacterium]